MPAVNSFVTHNCSQKGVELLRTHIVQDYLTTLASGKRMASGL